MVIKFEILLGVWLLQHFTLYKVFDSVIFMENQNKHLSLPSKDVPSSNISAFYNEVGEIPSLSFQEEVNDRQRKE